MGTTDYTVPGRVIVNGQTVAEAVGNAPCWREVKEARATARREALEEAAKICDEQRRMCLADLACAEHPADMTRLEIREEQAKTDAAEIRSLKEAR